MPPKDPIYRRVLRIFVRAVQPSVLVPHGIRLWLLRLVGMEIDEKALIKPGLSFLKGNVKLGKHCGISDNCFLEDHALITFGDYSGIGAGSMLITSTHDFGGGTKRHGPWRCEPITLGAGCWVGAGVTILPGVTIGEGCMVAAGAVVTEDCAPHGLYAGVPAVRKRDLPARDESGA